MYRGEIKKKKKIKKRKQKDHMTKTKRELEQEARNSVKEHHFPRLMDLVLCPPLLALPPDRLISSPLTQITHNVLQPTRFTMAS